MTLAEIRDDALETLNNYGERFTVEVAKLYPDDPDDDMGEMTITAMSWDGKRVLFRDTCFVRPTYRTYEDWEFDFTDAGDHARMQVQCAIQECKPRNMQIIGEPSVSLVMTEDTP